MEYFGSKLPFSSQFGNYGPCMHFSVIVFQIDFIFAGESYNFVYKKFVKDFLSIRVFPKFIEKVLFQPVILCWWISVFAISYRCNYVLSHRAGANRLLAFEEANSSVRRLFVNCENLFCSLFPYVEWN